MTKIIVKKIKIINGWLWNVKERQCVICQQDFEMMCVNCKHPIDCKPCIGKCGHIYHLHCIEEWTTNNKVCPYCRKDWSLKETIEFNLNKNYKE